MRPKRQRRTRGEARGQSRRGERRARSRGEARYLLLWKPYGVLSQFSTPANTQAPTLKSLVPISDVYPAGRLDRDSEGLLLLTNDGLFQHKLCDPRFAHWRTYWVQVERTPTAELIDRLRHGVEVKGKLTRPSRVRVLNAPPPLPPRDPPIRVRQTVETSWLSISLTEGMNRQVRRMTAAVGFPTLRLVRAEIELSREVKLTLDDLRPGAFRSLTSDELRGVQMIRDRQPTTSSRRS